MKVRQVSPPLTSADDSGARRADRRTLRRREPAGIDAADDEEEDEQHRPDFRQRLEALRIGRAFARSGGSGADYGHKSPR